MYRYVFDLCDFEHGDEYVLLHEKKFSNAEFSEICADIIKQSVIDNLRSRELPVINLCDMNLLNMCTYDDGYISASFDDDYNVLDYNIKRMFELFNERGFTQEVKEVETSFYANIYTYVLENLTSEVKDVIIDRCKNENVLVIDEYEKANELTEILSECKSKDEMIAIIEQWYNKQDKNKDDVISIINQWYDNRNNS